jgi:hypothetical protein
VHDLIAPECFTLEVGHALTMAERQRKFADAEALWLGMTTTLPEGDVVNEFSTEKRSEIIAALERANANEPCPRCRHNEFTLIDGYVNVLTHPHFSGALVLGGPTIPTVVTVCTRCGFISQHAVGALSLSPQEVRQSAGQGK